MFNVDSGYLTFKMAFGNFDSWVMKYGQQVSIFAVDNKSKRKDLYPEYKQFRNKDGNKDAVIEMVWALRKRVETEATLPLCSIEGLEADDIVACWQLFNRQDEIVGVDKDFFQLPGVNQTLYHNLQSFKKSTFIEHLPQYLGFVPFENFALYQMLMGDVADNIPRLLAKGTEGKKQLADIVAADKLGQLEDCLLSLFGNAIKINAGLVLLPYYEFGDFHEVFRDWFDCWCSGHYYDTWNWTKLATQIDACKLPNRVKQDVETLEMFSLI